MSVSINDKNNILHESVKLDEEFEFIDTPNGFKNLTLYPHQATIVKAMLDLEDKRTFTFSHKYTNGLSKYPMVVETDSMILSEGFGTGKTIELLALILERQVPRVVPTYLNMNKILCYGEKLKGKYLFTTSIKVSLNDENNIIRPNLIIIRRSVITQWMDTINKYTNLKVFCIKNSFSLRDFYKYLQEDRINNFDIILMKSGKVKPMQLDDEEQVDKYCTTLIETIQKMTRKKCWSRVIYDDFDFLGIINKCVKINSLFTIYVSSTKYKKQETIKEIPMNEMDILELINKEYALSIKGICMDKFLFTNFNVQTEEKYCFNSTRVPKLYMYKYICHNQDDKYIKLIKTMRDSSLDEITEMLNSDAIKTAADEMGLLSNSVSVIFQRILDKKYDKYIQMKKTFKNIIKIKNKIFSLEESHGETDKITEIVQDLKKGIGHEDLINNKEIRKLVENVIKNSENALNDVGKTINRVFDNIREEDCQICSLPLDGEHVFILKCCGIILCAQCGIKGNKIEGSANKMKGTCSNCFSTFDPITGMIYLNQDFDLNSLLDSFGDEEEMIIESKINQNIMKNKLNTIYSIIKNENIKAEKVDIQIPKLIMGTHIIERPDNIHRKFAIFSNYNESLNSVAKFLHEKNIKYKKLKGTYSEIANTIEEFRNTCDVLLINSSQNCSGLNLQFCSDMIIYHNIIDDNIASQVCGRIQRIGREYCANIHWLCYENEL